MNLQQQDRFYQMMTRLKANSRAASTEAPKEDVMITEITNGLIVTRPAKKYQEITNNEAKTTTTTSEPQVWNLTKNGPVLEQESKAGSTQYQTVVKEKKYDMGGSSTGEPIYQCGTHDYETRSLKEFNEHVARLPHNDTSSKAASAFVQENKLQEILRFQRSNGRL